MDFLRNGRRASSEAFIAAGKNIFKRLKDMDFSFPPKLSAK